MKTFGRMVVIVFASLILGILINQIHGQGLPWRLLVLSIPDGSRTKAWQPIPTEEAFGHYLKGEGTFLDIRSSDEFGIDHVPGARSFPFYEIFRQPDSLRSMDKSTLYIVYDFEDHSHKAPVVIQQMHRWGFDRVYFIRNGLSGWIDYGFPVEKGEGF